MDYNKVENQISGFIRRMVSESGMKKAVIGLSGGIDSTVVAYLTVKALGKENVYGIILPCEDNIYKNDAFNLAERLDINYEILSIKKFVDDFISIKHINDKIRIGNFMARIRMCILYDKAKELDALVIGTTNKTEMLLGYFTKYGDGAVDIEPIADLYKTEIFELAKYLGVPENIINKTPSADLWEGQTDEEELGMNYDNIDKILKLLSEEKVKIGTQENRDDIMKVLSIIKNNKHKTTPIPICIIDLKDYL